MTRSLSIAVVGASALLAPGAASALELDYVGVRAGTLGLGGEVGVSVIPSVSVRGVFNTFEYSFEEELDGVDYDGDLKLGSIGAQVDVKPFPLVPFYLTGGIYMNDNEVEAVSRPTSNVEIGGQTFTPAQVGTLRSSFTFEDVAPYAGIGSRFTVLKIQVNLEAGAYFQGAAQASLSADGTLSEDPAFQAELEEERRAIQEDLDNFEIYPAVTVGVRYKF